jgi:hypothetical protein
MTKAAMVITATEAVLKISGKKGTKGETDHRA